jgi:hypothetical protein
VEIQELGEDHCRDNPNPLIKQGVVPRNDMCSRYSGKERLIWG